MTRIMLDHNDREKSTALLAASLIDLVDLERQVKQAHWNVRGPGFIALHELFDRVSSEVRDFADTVAERLVTLGGTADATVQTVAAASVLAVHVASDVGRQGDHVSRTADLIAQVGARARSAVDEAGHAGDSGTADLFTEVSRGLDRHLWLVEANLG